MRIVECYVNILEECADTVREKDPECKNQKIVSLALKAIGAVSMLLGAQIAIGAIVAIPTSGLSLVALTCGVALAILGYDCAEIGHSIREQFTDPITSLGRVLGNWVSNMLEMGLEKGSDLTAFYFHARNTIVISKINKIAIHLSAP